MRTDIHSPSVFVPADYEPVFSYSLASSMGGWPMPSIGLNCELERCEVGQDGKLVKNGEHNPDGQCCIIGLRQSGARFAATGGTGKCSICGAVFIYGDVWRHKNGEHLHVGHNCADKYSMMIDRSAWELENGRIRAALATQINRAENAEERTAFLAEHSGLEEALALTTHPILIDLASKFQTYRSLSEKQVALALKLANEVKNPRAVEKHVPAPTGRMTVRGVLVSKKSQESAYGVVFKCTIKVETDGGSWLAWGTLPAALLAVVAERGDEVELTATLKPGRDAHFALMSRPTGGVILRRAQVVEAG